MNPYEAAIVRNADWFIRRESRDGYVDAEGDEFYGLRGDATLVGHSVSVRCYGGVLTGSNDYFDSARRSLDWLAERQDPNGGWRSCSAFTLDGAQCVFEGFNTYRTISGDTRYDAVLIRAADRMIAGTLDRNGGLLLPNIIEIGEYAHFALLAWKTTGEQRFRDAGETIVSHIERSFDEAEGMWRPFDSAKLRGDVMTRLLRPALRFSMMHVPLRGKLVARFADHLAPLGVVANHPQYSMSLMDAEALLDTQDGSCDFPRLREQTRAAIAWAESNCPGPFPGSVVESRKADRPSVYPIPIINDTRMAALWPTTCLLIAYCGMNDVAFKAKASLAAEWILTMQSESGAFNNFQHPDGSKRPLQSGNVNFYASMALWLYNELYISTNSHSLRDGK